LAATPATSLFHAELPERAAFVLGGETTGIGEEVSARVDAWLSIPMLAGVESLNVASAAAVLCFDLLRRRTM
ncbi:MAG: TrmH family RNA methyltransferase, partial [Sciscionella sp.]